MLDTPLARLRFVGVLEGISFLVLLGIAMPLKYLAGHPEMVYVFGRLHGLLFLLFVVMVARVAVLMRWSPWMVLGALAAAVVPFGPFVLDARLRQDPEARGRARS